MSSFPKKMEAQMISIIYIYIFLWLGLYQMVKESKVFIKESGSEFSVFERGKYAVNFQDSCQKNNELLGILAEQRECRAGLIESVTGRIF